MKELLEYYQNYTDNLGPAAYRMENHKQTSRIYFLVQYVKQYVTPGARI